MTEALSLRPTSTRPAVRYTPAPEAPAPASASVEPITEAVSLTEDLILDRHRNALAFWVGAVAGTFLQTFGVAHLLNGKIKRGLLYLLAGWLLWLPTTVLLLTSGIGVLVWVPLHVYLTYTNADLGAKLPETEAPTPADQ